MMVATPAQDEAKESNALEEELAAAVGQLAVGEATSDTIAEQAASQQHDAKRKARPSTARAVKAKCPAPRRSTRQSVLQQRQQQQQAEEEEGEVEDASPKRARNEKAEAEPRTPPQDTASAGTACATPPTVVKIVAGASTVSTTPEAADAPRTPVTVVKAAAAVATPETPETPLGVQQAMCAATPSTVVRNGQYVPQHVHRSGAAHSSMSAKKTSKRDMHMLKSKKSVRNIIGKIESSSTPVRPATVRRSAAAATTKIAAVSRPQAVECNSGHECGAEVAGALAVAVDGDASKGNAGRSPPPQPIMSRGQLIATSVALSLPLCIHP